MGQVPYATADGVPVVCSTGRSPPRRYDLAADQEETRCCQGGRAEARSVSDGQHQPPKPNTPATLRDLIMRAFELVGGSGRLGRWLDVGVASGTSAAGWPVRPAAGTTR
jgi:hypothetical protein